MLDPATGEPAYTGVVQATANAPTAFLAEVCQSGDPRRNRGGARAPPVRRVVAPRGRNGRGDCRRSRLQAGPGERRRASLLDHQPLGRRDGPVAVSASVGVGLMMSSTRRNANKRDLRAVHEALSLTALAMVALHGVALLGDSFLQSRARRHRRPVRRGVQAALDGARDHRRIRARRPRALLLRPQPHRGGALAAPAPSQRRLLASRDRPHHRSGKRLGRALVPGAQRRVGHSRGRTPGPALAWKVSRRRDGSESHSPSCFPRISFMISSVPPPIGPRRASRTARSMPYSRM